MDYVGLIKHVYMYINIGYISIQHFSDWLGNKGVPIGQSEEHDCNLNLMGFRNWFLYDCGRNTRTLRSQTKYQYFYYNILVSFVVL